MALPIELRERVVRAYNGREGGYEEIAARFCVGICSVRRWVALHRDTGSTEKRPHKGRKAKISIEELPELEALVLEKPDRTAEELTQIWIKNKKVEMHRSSLVRALIKLKMTVKKRHFLRPKETKNPFNKSGLNSLQK